MSTHIETVHATALMLEGKRVRLTYAVVDVIKRGIETYEFINVDLERIGTLAVEPDYAMRELTGEYGRDDWVTLCIDGQFVTYIDDAVDVREEPCESESAER